TEVIIEREGVKLKAFRDQADNIFIRTSDIPAEMRSDPLRLAGIRRLDSYETQIARNIETGQYRELANDLTRAPAVFSKRMDNVLSAQMEETNALIRQNKLNLAADHFRQLIDIHGRVPELTFRQALIETGPGSAERAAARLNSSLPRGIRDTE